MRPFLAQFSEPVWSGHAPLWAAFITIAPELKFSVRTRGSFAVKEIITHAPSWADFITAAPVLNL
jgi:hypothetical protein